MPTFVGYPLGGLLAEVVGPVDSVGSALAGGAITGAVIGLAQWLGLRRSGLAPEPWVVATSVGMALAVAAGAGAVGYGFSSGDLATQGAICGAVVGAAQAAALWPRLGAISLGWPVALAGIWSLGWTITAAAGIDVESQYTVFGSSGAIVATLATSILPLALASRPVRE